MEWPKFTNPYVGIKPPPGVNIPEREELLGSICTADEPRSGFPYPPEAPKFWIKYGFAVYWNEVCAQAVAYDGLRQIESSVRAPGVYYAFQEGGVTYIVMEYFPGKTAEQCLEETNNDAQKEVIYRSIASAVSELHRIPIPESRLRPAAVSGGKFRHSLFQCNRIAPLHYESAQQFEDNANAYLSRVNVGDIRIRDLAREPMVFCQSDLFPANFIIDDDNQVTVIDLADVSILPTSFAKFAVLDYTLGYNMVDISPWVYFPDTKGVDNIGALSALSGRITQGGEEFFEDLGLKLPGGEETQNRVRLTLQHQVTDEHTFDPGPTLGEVIAAREAEEKLGKEPDSAHAPYSYMTLNPWTGPPPSPASAATTYCNFKPRW